MTSYLGGLFCYSIFYVQSNFWNCYSAAHTGKRIRKGCLCKFFVGDSVDYFCVGHNVIRKQALTLVND